MALPLGKLTILIGAGIVGSVLAKEGRFSTVSDFCSGAFKVNSLRQELQLLASNRPITIVTSSGSGSSKYGIIVIVIVVASGYVWWKVESQPKKVELYALISLNGINYKVLYSEVRTRALMLDVCLDQEQGRVLSIRDSQYASLCCPLPFGGMALESWLVGGPSSCEVGQHMMYRAHMIGVIHVLVVGSQGWKLPDMMFATKRSLSDACNTIAKQLENVYSSIAASFSSYSFCYIYMLNKDMKYVGNVDSLLLIKATKRHLSSKIDRVDRTLEESAELTAATREEVSELRGEIQVIGVDVQSVHHVVRTLETKISRIEGKQAAPSSSSRPALEMPQILPPARTGSLPPIPPVEPPSPSNGSRNTSPSNGSRKGNGIICLNLFSSNKVMKHRYGYGYDTDNIFQELQGISEIVEALSSPGISNGLNVTEDTNNNGNSNSGLFGRRISGISASFLTRTRSAVQSFK
ncbi:hypothetical protein TEA_025678 [Camellia sinensis var. sinensis]|uniref:DUF1664 domain-containing protein n=1 Tax=Camellia sinensis var. sinensis TaxID=542762 RepID=A0A4S4CV63_CAMSN|nr:hypothetical protein TEA_025678 [Camellia sinensis var. sinensis]